LRYAPCEIEFLHFPLLFSLPEKIEQGGRGFPEREPHMVRSHLRWTCVLLISLTAAFFTATDAVAAVGVSTVDVTPNGPLPADGTTAYTFTVTVQDKLGAPLVGIHVQLQSGNGTSEIISYGGTPNVNIGVTDGSGVVVFTVSDATGDEFITLQAVDIDDNVVLDNFTKFSPQFFGPVSPVNSQVFVNSFSFLPANGVATGTVVVALADSKSFPVIGKTVSLSAGAGHATISPPTIITDNMGLASFTVSSTTVEQDTLTATDVDDNVVLTQTGMLTFTGLGDPLHTTVEVSGSNSLAAGSTGVIIVKVADINGFPISGDTITLTDSTHHAVIIPQGTNVSNGSGSVSFTVGDGTIEDDIFTATDITSGFVIAQTATLTFTAATPGVPSFLNSTVVATPPGAPLASSVTVTVTLLDSAGNPVTSTEVDCTASMLIINGKFNQNFAISDKTTGVATFTISDPFSFAISSDVLLSAFDKTFGTIALPTITIKFFGNLNVSNSTINASPTAVASDGTATSAITVRLLDNSGIPLNGKHVTLALNPGANAAIQPGPVVTDASGFAVFTVSDSTPEIVTLTATDTDDSATLLQTANVEFAPAADKTKSTVTPTPPSVVADGQTKSTITVIVNDAAGAPVGGKFVTMSAGSGTSKISTASGSSDAVTGSVTFDVTDIIPETVVYTATISSDNLPITQTASVTFTQGGASGRQSSADANPTLVLADGLSSSTITVTLRDAARVPVAGKTVVLSKNPGSSAIISTPSGPSDAKGQVTFTVTDAIVEQTTFTAKDTTDNADCAGRVVVDFINGISVLKSSVVASPPTVSADGTTASTITVTVINLDNTFPPFALVTLTKGGGFSNIAPNIIYEPKTGQISYTVVDTVAEKATYTATVLDGMNPVPFIVAQTATVNFIAGLPTTSQGLLLAAPATVPADGISTSTILVLLKDTTNNPVSGATVSLSGTGSSTISAASGPSDASGLVTFNVSDSVAEKVVYTAKDTTNNVTFSSTAAVTFTPVPAKPTLSLSSAPTASPVIAGTGQTIQFSTAASLTGTTFSWSFGDGASDSSGQATVAHAYSTAGDFTATVTATNGGSIVTGTVTVTIKAPTIGSGADSDGDGFSDSAEVAAGTDPHSSASLPFPLTIPTPSTFSATIAVTLNFAKNADGLVLTGTLPVPAGFAGGQVLLNVGTYSNALKLDAKGKAKTTTAQGMFAIKNVKGVVAAQTSKFTIKIVDKLEAALAAFGLVNSTVKDVSVLIPVTLTFAGTVNQATLAAHYTGTAGKTGKTSK
jgi:hypothetical protein